jgi:hypothetical protein
MDGIGRRWLRKKTTGFGKFSFSSFRRWISWVLLLGLTSSVNPAEAGYFELSAGFSFGRRGYSDEAYNWTRRWGLSVGYYFNETAEVEVSFQDVFDRSFIPGYEDTHFHDQVYSLNWVQGFLPRTFPIQPYTRVGFGQLNRVATGTYANGAVPTQEVASLTAVVGLGLKIQIMRGISLKLEGISYIPTSNIDRWKDNYHVDTGIAIFY